MIGLPVSFRLWFHTGGIHQYELLRQQHELTEAGRVT